MGNCCETQGVEKKLWPAQNHKKKKQCQKKGAEVVY